MDKNVVDSSKDDHTIHNLSDYAIALEVTRDHPRIIEVYKKLLPVLYGFAQYQGVWPIIQMVEDSKLLLEMQLTFYSKIKNTKGLVNGSKTEK